MEYVMVCMGKENSPPAPPVDLPDDIGSVLQDATVHDLRESLIYAQELLQYNHEPTEQIEPLPGEEIVEIKGEGKRFTVLKRQPCADSCPNCPHGPYVYEVTQEKRLNGDTHFHWAFIGPYVDEE
ncbi:hypothetical protein RBH20_19235 [Haloarcula sp. H-GB4]|uniref:hypothetical protein n=1 Tax=Haloarcula sp. H-GB4 TaxID=3069755 RepID=UPI0027AE1FA1|nr:hypothetical protein [Haloarcula sp. H-GB4]MDQ2074666.1 hypothetical protein [Haloarcula sp. H-GB4]